MRKRLKLILVFLIILTATLIPGRTIPPQERKSFPSPEALKAYESFVVEQMAFDGIPGLSVGFIKGDFTWSKGFGYADLENKAPAKPESSYRLASITKTITATAILQLVEEGKIDLDSDIQAYVPYFPRKRWPVTVRQLLGHLGGISHYKNYAAEGHIKEPQNTRQALAIFQDFDLVAEPGTRYNYSTYGFNLLGAAIEGASGLSYQDYITKYIFKPLGMEDSRLDNPRDLIPNRVRGYERIKGELKNSEFVDISSRFAGGGLRSTVVDLLKYARGVMDGKILKEATYKKMFASMALRNGFFTWYGMGWAVRPWGSHFAVSHSGSQPETRTHLLIFPTEQFAVAIASNLEGANLVPYVRRLIELVLDEDIDRTAYAPDRARQSIYQAIFYAYAWGISTYDWNKAPLSKSLDSLKYAFSYFNNCVNEGELRKNSKETIKKITAGIHLASNQAFTSVGSYMAQALEEEGGRELLLSYQKRGPIAFFTDFIKLSTENSGPKKYPRFKPEFITLLANWEKDWNKTYTDYVRHLVITPATNFEEAGAKLKETFNGASFYPDFTSDLARAAQYFLRKNNPAKAVSILALGQDLYPSSPVIWASLGLANLWQGHVETSRDLYQKAFAFDPTHPILSSDQFLASADLLVQADKMREAQALANIAIEFYPKEAGLYVGMSNVSLLVGQKEKAVEYLKKALKINPNLEEAKTKLKALEKQRGE
jgi:CubicO group peptidase (beta-lactamase class C family)